MHYRESLPAPARFPWCHGVPRSTGRKRDSCGSVLPDSVDTSESGRTDPQESRSQIQLIHLRLIRRSFRLREERIARVQILIVVLRHEVAAKLVVARFGEDV